MKILTLDLATTTGICVGVSGADPKAWSISLGDAPYIKGGMSQADKFKLESKRLNNALIMTQGLIQTHSPDLIVAEAAIGGKNANSYLIKLFGCVQACAANRGIPVEPAHIGTVRKHFLGKALSARDFPHLKPADAKKAIKQRVMQQCAMFGWPVETDDEGDAVAIWEWACAIFARGYQSKPIGGLF